MRPIYLRRIFLFYDDLKVSPSGPTGGLNNPIPLFSTINLILEYLGIFTPVEFIQFSGAV